MTKSPSTAKADSDEREVPAIKPQAFTWQSQGFAWREAFVRLPEGIVAQDLQDSPTVWRKVQDNGNTALKKFDRVMCVANDETFVVNAMVAEADRSKATLADFKITKLPGNEATFENAEYSIKWGGPGFAVYRKRDGVQAIPTFFETIEQAKSEMLRTLYKAKAA